MPTDLFNIAMTGASALTGALSGKTNARTTAPQFSPDQLGMQHNAGQAIADKLANPTNLSPMKTAAFGQIDKAYDSAGDRLDSRLAGNGYGKSGKRGTNQKQLEIARAGDIGSTESRFAGLQADENNKTLQQALQFGFTSPGQKTSGGGGLAGGISGGLETASLLYALNHFLGGGGKVGDVPGGPGTFNASSMLAGLATPPTSAGAPPPGF